MPARVTGRKLDEGREDWTHGFFPLVYSAGFSTYTALSGLRA
jgi:hypothetical protein